MGGRRLEIGVLSGCKFSFDPDLSDTALIGPKFEVECNWGGRVNLTCEFERNPKKFDQIFQTREGFLSHGRGKVGGWGARVHRIGQKKPFVDCVSQISQVGKEFGLGIWMFFGAAGVGNTIQG